MTQPANSERIGKYILLDAESNRGGQGKVFQAYNPSLGINMPVAIKKPLFPDDEEYVRNFRREAQHSCLLKHNNIVDVLDADEEDGAPYLVMEWLDTSLMDVLQGSDPGKLSWEQAAKYGMDICKGLAYAHNFQSQDQSGDDVRGFIHRDIKPANLMLAPGGEIKIIDFGLAYAIHASSILSSTGVFAGTLPYMAPEQITESEDTYIDHRADIYALGITLYQLITGDLPFNDSNPFLLSKMIEAKPLPRIPRDLDIPEKFLSVIEKATQKDRDNRYVSAKAMSEELQLCVQDLDNAKVTGYAAQLLADIAPIVEQFESFKKKYPQDDINAILDAIVSPRNGEIDAALEREAEVVFEDSDDLIAEHEYRVTDPSIGKSSSQSVNHYMRLIDEANRIVTFMRRTRGRSGKSIDGVEFCTSAINLIPDRSEAYILRAELYRRTGLYEEAISDLSVAIQLEPEIDTSWDSRAILYQRMDRFEEAIADLSHVISVNSPRHRDRALRRRAYCHFRNGDYKSAILDFSEYIDRASASSQTGNLNRQIRLRAKCYAQVGMHSEAIDDFTYLIDLHANWSNLSSGAKASHYRGRAESLIGIDSYEEAIRDFTEVISLEPRDYVSYVQRGSIRSLYGNYDGAISDYNSAIQISPGLANELKATIASFHSQIGQHEESIKLLSEVIELTPDDFTALENRATAYSVLARFDEAERDYSEIIRLKPDEALGYFGRSRLYSALGKSAESIRDLDDLIRIRSSEKYYYMLRGSEKQKTGAIADSISDYDVAISLDSEYRDAYIARGTSRILMGDNSEAINDGLIAVGLDDSNALVHLMIAEGLQRLGNENNRVLHHYEAAIELHIKSLDSETVIGCGAEYPVVLAQSGIIYAALNEYEKALSFFSAAIEVDDSYDDAYALRAACYSDQDMNSQAISDLKDAIRLNPNAGDYRVSLANLAEREADYDLAREQYDFLLENDSLENNEYIYFSRRAVCRIELGDLSGAHLDLEHALEYRNFEINLGWEMPSQIGPYQIVDLVAEGGLSTVYNGIHPLSGETFAIRTEPSWVDDAQLKARIEAEYNLLKVLNHPNVVRMVDHGQDPETGTNYSVLEFLPWDLGFVINGVRLQKILDLEKGEDSHERMCLEVVLEVAKGLEYIHSIGIIHGDVKPSNIRISDDGAIKLTNFLLFKCKDDNLRETMATMDTWNDYVAIGTYGFMPKEILSGGELDGRTDVYSLGATFYSMLINSPIGDEIATHAGDFQTHNTMPYASSPFTNSFAPTEGDIEALVAGLGEFREEISRLLRSMLSENKSDRITSDLLVNALKEILSQRV